MKSTRVFAEHALKEVAYRNGVTVKEIRNEIQLAMLAGMNDSDPAVQAKWNEIPSAEDTLTPEELISCIADSLIKK